MLGGGICDSWIFMYVDSEKLAINGKKGQVVPPVLHSVFTIIKELTLMGIGSLTLTL